MTNPTYTDEQVLEHAAWQSIPTKAMILSLLADRQRLQAAVPDNLKQNGQAALAELSNALDDLQYSPDQRPVPLIREAMERIKTMLTAAPQPPEGARAVDGDVRLWDTQWMSIVNHDYCYRDWSKDDAIAHAVKMTEEAIARNVADGKLPKARTSAAHRPIEGGRVVDGWQPIENAPTDGTLHVRGLWVRTPRGSYFDAVVGGINDEGEFVDLDHDSTRWDASDYTHWHRLSAAPTLAGKEGT